MQFQSGMSYKQSYLTSEERVKFYFYQPLASQVRRNIRITINIRALTPDFYPTIMVNKNTYSQPQNDPGQTLIYPTYAAANYTFGDNFTAVAQTNEVKPLLFFLKLLVVQLHFERFCEQFKHLLRILHLLLVLWSHRLEEA
jgi:hypothetical protein